MLNEDFQLQMLIVLMNYYLDERFLVDVPEYVGLDDDVVVGVVVVVVVADDNNYNYDVLLVRIVAYNNIHRNTYQVDTIVVVVAAGDDDLDVDYNERLVNLFPQVYVFVFYYDYFRYCEYLNKLLAN
jgi:hypothetical protein